MPRKRPLDVETLWKLARIGGLALAPDGSAAVCTATRFSMEENRGRSSLWLLDTRGAPPRQLTTAGEKDAQPAWSPRGDRIAFLAKREHDGRKDAERQLYLIDAHGGEARRLTDFAPGVEDFKWMPDGRGIVFIAWVWPDLRGAKAQARRFKEFTDRKESAYVTTEALYRDFDHGLPMGRVPHLLLVDVESGRITDLLEGTGYELPRMDLAASQFDIAPDGRRIAFVHDPRPRKTAVNTLALAELTLRGRRIRPLTRDAAWSFDAPRYSPDGARIACVATNLGRRHTMPGRLALLRPVARPRIVGESWVQDLEGSGLRWARDGASLLFAAEERGRRHLYRYDLARDALRPVLRGGWVQFFDVAGEGADETIVAGIEAASHPVRVYGLRGGVARRLDRFNDDVLGAVAFGETREATVRGARGDRVQMFLTFPPGFDPRRKYPVLQVIHGGPYAAAGDSFQYRWNTHVFAAQGYVVAAVNYHGSSGFGFAFRDAITGHLGEYELRDIEAGTDWVLAQPWADRRNVFAAGGSYGGFMVAWMNGHVPRGRYRAYVCHAGVFDRVATFSADSYLHRPKDLGAFFWEDPAKVLSQSPHSFAHRMETPTLVIHGNNDYRVPDTNGLAYYNTLQARGVPARLVWFPDENHWILKPRNSRLWYREFFAWLSERSAPASSGRRAPSRSRSPSRGSRARRGRGSPSR